MNHQVRESVTDLIRTEVRREVRAHLRRTAMARNREEFINRLVEVLIPALTHHYRATLATLNNKTDQVAKWREHEEDFLDQLRIRMRERTKAKGLDRMAAADRALEEMMDHDDAGRRAETSKFQATYKTQKTIPLPKDAHQEFIGRVREILNDMFPD